MQLRLNCFHGVRRDKTNKHQIATKKAPISVELLTIILSVLGI